MKDKKQNIQLLIIDPQNDFCDLPADWCPADPVTGQTISPALPVAGAHADMLRLAGLIREGLAAWSSITVTLDSHHRFDIAHPTFWASAAGENVVPFTSITAAQVRNGDYLPKDPAMLPRALAYLDALEQRGRYTLMVWPVHCEMGNWGHNIHPAVKAACNLWEDSRLGLVQKISKGSNPWTEHYSAMQAEVPDDDDPATQLNTALIAALDQSDLLVIAGEASSHCVRATTEHIVQNLPSGQTGKVLLLTDCMSAVGGFEAQQQDFFDDMANRGVVLTSSSQLLSTLPNNN
ncbi:MAG: cysteine hydrolase [Pseudomonadota bacterium]